MGTVVHHIGYIDKEELEKCNNDERVKVWLYKDFSKERVLVPKKLLRKIGFFVRGGDSLFGEGDTSIIPSRYANYVPSRFQKLPLLPRKQCITEEFLSEFIRDGRYLSNIEHEKTLSDVLKNTTSFASYYFSLSLMNESNSLLKYRNIWTGFHLVVHSGGEVEADEVKGEGTGVEIEIGKSKKKKEEEEEEEGAESAKNTTDVFYRFCFKNRMGENVFNVYNSSKLSVLINTNFDFLIFMYYYSKNLFHPREKIHQMPMLNFNWFVYILDFEKVSPLEVLRKYLVKKNISTASTMTEDGEKNLAAINYLVDCLKHEHFAPFGYGFEKMIFSEARCQKAIQLSFQKMKTFCEANIPVHHDDISQEEKDEEEKEERGRIESENEETSRKEWDERKVGERGRGEDELEERERIHREGEEEEEEMEWEREALSGESRELPKNEERKAIYCIVKKIFCEKHFGVSGNDCSVVFDRCPACFFEIFDERVLVGRFHLYEGFRETMKQIETSSFLRLDGGFQKLLDQLKSVKEKMILKKMEKLAEEMNPRWNCENSVTLFIFKSLKLLFNDETCEYTKHLNSLLIRLINFRDRGNFEKSIFPILNPFGKMVMLDMLNSTIVREPENHKDGRIICNYDTGVTTTDDLVAADDECEMTKRRYWSFSTINTHMTRQFQIYRWVSNRNSSSLPFNINNLQRIPVFESDDADLKRASGVDGFDFESYQAYGKLYVKNKVHPLSYFEEISLLKKVYNNATFKIVGNRLEMEREINEKVIAADIVDYFSTKNEFGINYDVTLNNILGLENANIRTGNEIYEISAASFEDKCPDYLQPNNDSCSKIPPPSEGDKKILCFVRNEEQESLLKYQSKLMASFFDTETTGLDAIVERMYSLAVCVRPVFEKDIKRVYIFVVAPYAKGGVANGVNSTAATSKSKDKHSSFRERITKEVTDLFRQKKSLYGKLEKWECFIFDTEAKMLTAVDSFFYSNFHMFTYLVGFNVTFDLSFLLVRMIINNVDSEIFQLRKLALVDKINILKAYRASKSIINRNSGGRGGAAEASSSSSSSSTSRAFNPNTKNYDRFLQILRAILIPEICFFDMQKMVRLKFSQLSSYNLNSCVENVCGKEQMEIEEKMIIDVRDLLYYFRGSSEESLKKAACIHAYCVHDAALVSLLESSLNTVMEQASLGSLTGKTFDTLIGWAPKGSKVVQACFEHDVKRKNENLVSITGYYDNHNNDQCSTKGGLVITPIQMSISDYGVITLDFASLYPSIMITNNCCPSTFVFHSQIVRAVDRRRGKSFLTPDHSSERLIKDVSNKSIEKAVDDEKAINVFSAQTRFCSAIAKYWVPYNVIVKNYNHEADKANARYLGVDYFPRHSFPSWIELRGYWREDVQVQPTGLKYYFPLLYDLVDVEYEGRKELLESVFYPFGTLVNTVWDLGRLIAALLEKAIMVAEYETSSSKTLFSASSSLPSTSDEGKDDELKKNIGFLHLVKDSLRGNRGGGKKGIKRALDILYANETECPFVEEFVRGIASRCWDCGSYCRFWVCKSRLKDGCWPDLQSNLGEMRKKLKKKMKDKTLNPHERQLANIDQNNVKVMMNSAYGMMSGKHLKSSFNQLLSNLITGIGRRTTANIKIAGNLLVDNLQNIYGDTDSTFSTIRSPCFRRRRVNNRFLDVDIKLEQDVCDFIEKNIGRVLWGMRPDRDYLAGKKNVMNLVPERMVLFGFLFRKKNYVLCHFSESPEVDQLLKEINKKCDDDRVGSGSGGTGRNSGDIESRILRHCQIIQNPYYQKENEEENDKVNSDVDNRKKFRVKPSKYIVRLDISHLINMFLNSNFKSLNKNKNYAKHMLTNQDYRERKEMKEEDGGEIEDLDEEMMAGMDLYKSLFQIYKKGQFCKGDINVLASQLHYLLQICFVFKVNKNRVFGDMINSILEFQNPYSKLSQYKKCSKPNLSSNFFQAMLEHNERTPRNYKIFTDLVLNVKSRYANMLCVETIEEATSSTVDAANANGIPVDGDGRKKLGKRKKRCSDFWLKRTLQIKKTWDERRGMGTLSGRNILNKSAIVNVFILILDGLKVFTDAFGTMVEERIALSFGKKDYNGICFDVNGNTCNDVVDSDTDTDADGHFVGNHRFCSKNEEAEQREEEGAESFSTLPKVFSMVRKRKLSFSDPGVNKRFKTREEKVENGIEEEEEEESVESPSSSSLKVFPMFRKRKLSFSDPGVNKRPKTREEKAEKGEEEKEEESVESLSSSSLKVFPMFRKRKLSFSDPGVNKRPKTREEKAEKGEKEKEEESVESPSSSLKVFPVFRKRKLSFSDSKGNKRIKTRDGRGRELKSFIDIIIDQENIEGVVKELKNCCPEIAEELFFASRSYAFFKTLCEMIKPNSAYMYCPNPNCSQTHFAQMEKSASSLSSSSSSTKRINCKEKKDIVFPSIDDRMCAIGVCDKLKSFRISSARLFASLMETVTTHVRECNLFVGTAGEKMIVPILKLCWGNPQCRDACDFMLDTHMYLVLFYLQTSTSRDARVWVETEFENIFSNSKNSINPNPFYETLKRCLRNFEYYYDSNLVYNDSSIGRALPGKANHYYPHPYLCHQPNKKMNMSVGEKKMNYQFDQQRRSVIEQDRNFDGKSRVNRGIFPEHFVSRLTFLIIWEFCKKNFNEKRII